MRHVEIYCRDYKNANGLMVPIESMVVNRELDDSLFLAQSPNPSAK